MKRSILIIVGIVIILLLFGVWAYLLFFGKSVPNNDIFGNLGITPADDVTITPLEPLPEDTQPPQELAVDHNPLTQLTTRPVIGFRYIERGGNGDVVVYAEEGTGHVYEINPDTSTENRVTNTTIANATEAVFSASGTEAVILSGDDGLNAVIGTVEEDQSLDLRAIPVKVTEMEAVGTSDVLFLGIETDQSVGRQLNVRTLTERVLFTVPFTTASVAWGETAAAPAYVFPRPAALLPGYLYKANSTSLLHTGIEGFGLSVRNSENYWLVAKTIDRTPRSYFVEKSTLRETPTPFYILPQKCTHNMDFPDTFYCASALGDTPGTQPDDWFKGKTVFSDDLWLLSATNGEALLLSSLESESGQVIDVKNIALGKNGSVILFTNKLDNTLWMYDLARN